MFKDYMWISNQKEQRLYQQLTDIQDGSVAIKGHFNYRMRDDI